MFLWNALFVMGSSLDNFPGRVEKQHFHGKPPHPFVMEDEALGTDKCRDGFEMQRRRQLQGPPQGDGGDAQLNLLQARSSLARASRDYLAARVNLAWACMQCHDGNSAFAITSYTEAAQRAQGMHGN